MPHREVETAWRDKERDEEVGEAAVGRENEERGEGSEDTGRRLSARKTSQVIANFAKATAESFKKQ